MRRRRTRKLPRMRLLGLLLFYIRCWDMVCAVKRIFAYLPRVVDDNGGKGRRHSRQERVGT